MAKHNLHYDRPGWAGLVSVTLLAFCPMATLAQITGDGSLGTQVNGSEIAPCTGTCIITNGTTRGSNLFHSFRQFSLPNGDFAGFITTPAIQNVIVRVTGVGQPFISTINGTIATSNPANFFLLNPNGILFGPGAALNIGGSFLATTANRMQFADSTEFRTDVPAPLLTISVPIGLQFGTTSGTIQAREARLAAGQTDAFGDFALVGGDVTLDDAAIQTPGRQIALGGVDENGTVGLQLTGDHLSLSVAADTLRRDVTLTNGSFINTFASTGGGGITVTGRNLRVSDSIIATGVISGTDNATTNQAGDITLDATAGLQLIAGSIIGSGVAPRAIGQGGNIYITAATVQAIDGSAITASTQGNGRAGNVQVTANTITLDGTIPSGQASSGISSLVSNTANGSGGNVIVQASLLTITNGAVVSASTFGNGNAGNVQIHAQTIAVDGTTPGGEAPSGIVSQVGSIASGHGGSVTVATHSLTLTNGATVSASTFGNGNAGNVQVTADTIAVDGTAPDERFISTIASQVRGNGIGNGGDVTVKTGSLTITNGATVSASTFANGNAGNVRVTANNVAVDGTSASGNLGSGISSRVNRTATGRGGDVIVETDSLRVTNGAGVAASTFGNGNGGNVRVAANTITLDGSTPDGRSTSGIGSIVGNTGSGRGGNVTIATDSLTVTNGAGVSSSAFGNGSAGNLDITARTLRLDFGGITAVAISGDGANITLNVHDLLLMRHASEISTSAGLAGAGGNGGNITINAPRGFLVAAPNENNDITANAFNGSGGNVTIAAAGIYWFTPRSRAELAQRLGTNDPTQLDPRRLPTNDITAISQGNPDLSGTVAITILNLDPSRGLVTLPVNLTDPSQQISQSCTPGSKTSASSFVATGHGGIPLNPDEPLEGRAVVTTQWVPLPEERGDTGWGSGAVKKAEEARGKLSKSQTRLSEVNDRSDSNISSPIVEFQGWIVGADGVVELVASVPSPNSVRVWSNSVACPSSQKH